MFDSKQVFENAKGSQFCNLFEKYNCISDIFLLILDIKIIWIYYVKSNRFFFIGWILTVNCDLLKIRLWYDDCVERPCDNSI